MLCQILLYQLVTGNAHHIELLVFALIKHSDVLIAIVQMSGTVEYFQLVFLLRQRDITDDFPLTTFEAINRRKDHIGHAP